MRTDSKLAIHLAAFGAAVATLLVSSLVVLLGRWIAAEFWF